VSKQVGVDNTGPEIVVNDGLLITEGYIVPNVTATDAHQTSMRYEWVADDDNPGFFDFDATTLNPELRPTVEGSYIFYLTATDDFGNRSTATFTFDYKEELEQLPTPDTTNPIATQTNNQDAPSFTPPTPQSVVVSRSADSEAGRDGENVLGDAVQRLLSGNDTADKSAVLAATPDGWRIFGVLWYWWALVGIGLVGLVFALRRWCTGNRGSSVN
jgi:hypothetical protein